MKSTALLYFSDKNTRAEALSSIDHFIRSVKVSTSNAFAYISILKLAYAILK